MYRAQPAPTHGYPGSPRQETVRPPNVLYVVLDDVGFGALSCCGEIVDTPNIDRIAEAGLRYNQWHTTALCSPTRSCLRPCQLMDWPHCRERRCSGPDDTRNDRNTHRSGYRSGRRSGCWLPRQSIQRSNPATPATSWTCTHARRRPDPHHEPDHRRIPRFTLGGARGCHRVVADCFRGLFTFGFRPGYSGEGKLPWQRIPSAGWSSKHGCFPPAHDIDGPKRKGVHPGRLVAPMPYFTQPAAPHFRTRTLARPAGPTRSLSWAHGRWWACHFPGTFRSPAAGSVAGVHRQ